MADKNVTVNVQANVASAIDDFNNVGRGVQTPQQSVPSTNSTDNTSVIPAYDRLAQDIRREMLNRGALMVPGSSNFNQLMSAVQQKYRSESYKQIDDKYSQGVNQTQIDFENKRKTELERLEQERQDKLANAPTPNTIDRINDQYNRSKKRLGENIDIEKALSFKQLGDERDNEKAKVEQDLARIAAELVQELRRGNPNSYSGRLRNQYRDAIYRRDNAETEDEARSAAEEAAAIQKRMSNAMQPVNRLAQLGAIAGGTNQVLGIIDRHVSNIFANTSAQISEINSAANGDVFAAMAADLQRRKTNTILAGAEAGTLAGGILGGILAASGSVGVGTGAGIGIGAGVGGSVGTGIAGIIWNITNGKDQNLIEAGQLWQQQEQRIQQYNEIALVDRMRNQSLSDTREKYIHLMTPDAQNIMNGGGISYYDLGYTGSQFSQIAAQRLKQRGFLENLDSGNGNSIIDYAVKQIALERTYNLSEGSLAQLSSYDRYGNNANQTMANLIASLDKRKTLGMSGGRSLRANEFLNYQTQLMEMQKGWMDAPNANYATRLLLAAQNAFGNNLDSRAINEISQIENTVTHPKEDYSKALLYDVIQDIMPETKGNLLEIRKAQYSDDPNVRMKIQQEMVKRIKQVYGGLDTTSGYLAASHYFGIEDPVRLAALLNQYEKGLPGVTKGNVEEDVNSIEGYTPRISKDMLQYQDDTVKMIQSGLDNLSDLSRKMLTDFKSKLDDVIGAIHKISL